MRISENFTLEEMIKSQTAARLGIRNTPDFIQTCRLFHLVNGVLQPLRDMIRMPIYVSSGFRSEELNREVGGANNSQHKLGEAADIEVPGLSNLDLYQIIKDHFIFDQLILEFHNPAISESGWVHVSYTDERDNRMQAFSIG